MRGSFVQQRCWFVNFVNVLTRVIHRKVDKCATLRLVQCGNIVRNIEETTKLLCSRSASSQSRNQIHTVQEPRGLAVPVQRVSNYCSLCCINNILGPNCNSTYTFTLHTNDVKEVADSL